MSSTGEARRLSGATFSSADLAGLRARAAGLSLNAHRSNRSGRAGTRLLRFRGRGMEYSESRMYLPGDDIRSIDWRVTARTGRVHTKLFHEERDRPVLFVVDLGEQMRFGTRRAFMSVVAAETASLRAPARYPRRRRPARHQRRLMEDLRRRIDELAARECLPWQRDGNRVRISLSRSGRSQIVRLARRKDRYVFSSVVAHASAVNEDRRSLAFRIWRRNADVGREGAGPYGCFDLWLRVNGADVANSNVQLCQDEGSRAKDVIISQGIVPMEAGGYAGSADVGEQPGGGDVHRSDPAVR